MRKSMTTVYSFGKIKSVPKRAYNFGHVSSRYLNIRPMKSSPRELIGLREP